MVFWLAKANPETVSVFYAFSAREVDPVSPSFPNPIFLR